MSDGEPREPHGAGPAAAPEGHNLTWLYSLLAIALVAAIVLALLIVLPFYHRR